MTVLIRCFPSNFSDGDVRRLSTWNLDTERGWPLESRLLSRQQLADSRLLSRQLAELERMLMEYARPIVQTVKLQAVDLPQQAGQGQSDPPQTQTQTVWHAAPIPIQYETTAAYYDQIHAPLPSATATVAAPAPAVMHGQADAILGVQAGQHFGMSTSSVLMQKTAGMITAVSAHHAGLHHPYPVSSVSQPFKGPLGARAQPQQQQRREFDVDVVDGAGSCWNKNSSVATISPGTIPWHYGSRTQFPTVFNGARTQFPAQKGAESNADSGAASENCAASHTAAAKIANGGPSASKGGNVGVNSSVASSKGGNGFRTLSSDLGSIRIGIGDVDLSMAHPGGLGRSPTTRSKAYSTQPPSTRGFVIQGKGALSPENTPLSNSVVHRGNTLRAGREQKGPGLRRPDRAPAAAKGCALSSNSNSIAMPSRDRSESAVLGGGADWDHLDEHSGGIVSAGRPKGRLDHAGSALKKASCSGKGLVGATRGKGSNDVGFVRGPSHTGSFSIVRHTGSFSIGL